MSGDRCELHAARLAARAGLGGLEALAFDRAGHRITCLATDGTIDVVPVP